MKAVDGPTWPLGCGAQTSNAESRCGDLPLRPWPEQQIRHQDSPVLCGALDELNVHGCWVFTGTATVFW